MRIGVIGAMQMEVDELKASMENAKTEEYSGVTYVSGTIEGKEVVAAVCGIGKVFAAICAEAMILKFNVDCVINIGVAGTLCFATVAQRYCSVRFVIRDLLSCHIHMIILPHDKFGDRHDRIPLLFQLRQHGV